MRSPCIVAKINAKVLVIAYVDQTLIVAPAFGVDDACNVSASPNDRLSRALCGIRHTVRARSIKAEPAGAARVQAPA
jgi:hypothetical protein